MIIDVHAHYLPESAVRAHELDQSWHGTSICRDERGILVAETAGKRFVFGSPTHFEPLANRIERMDARGVDTELLSLLPPLFRYGLPAADGIAAAKDVNDELSELAARFPGRILGLATLPLQDPEASIVELERAMKLPGITGVTIGTHVNGTDLDAEELAPVFRAMHDLDAFLFIHPMDQRAAGVLSKYYLRNIIGNPLETTIAAAALMLSGRLDELPRLQVCLAHGGGYVVPAVGRMQHGFGVREETPSGAGTPPRDQFRRFLYDTLTHDEAGLRHLIDQVGADHVVLGTDFPADMGQTDAALEIQASGLFTEEEKTAVLGANLARVLGLTGESGRTEKAATHG